MEQINDYRIDPDISDLYLAYRRQKKTFNPSTQYTCRYCRKKFGDQNALRDHLSAKHTLTQAIPFFSTEEANTLEKISCDLCSKKFPDLNALLQHTKSKHNASKVLIDENISLTEPCVRQLCHVYRHKAKAFPTTLLGMSDEAVIQYARDHNYGIITRDKRCARVAVHYLSPVYLVINEKAVTSIIKFN
jgi:predicted nuclease of predicted toxin-antitoxin system